MVVVPSAQANPISAPPPALARNPTEHWHQRTDLPRAAAGRTPPTRLVALPETVILTEIFCDPDWRHRTGTADLYLNQRRFSLHVTSRIGLAPLFAASVHITGDPLRTLGRPAPGPSP